MNWSEPTVTPGQLVAACHEHGVNGVLPRVTCALRNELNESLVFNRDRRAWEIDPYRGDLIIAKWFDFVSERRTLATLASSKRHENGNEDKLFTAVMEFLGVERTQAD